MAERSQLKRRMKAQRKRVGEVTEKRKTRVKRKRDQLQAGITERKQAEEAVARFDAQYSTEVIPGGAFAATLSQLRDAHALSRLGKNRRVHTRET